MSDSVWPHGLQHSRLPCPSLSPKVCSNSCLLNWWHHPSTSCSATHFSFGLQFLPASGSFPISSHQVSKVLELQLQHQPFQWTFRLDFLSVQFSSVQSLSCVQLFATPWTAACQGSLSVTNSQSFPNSYPLSQWCHPTISSSFVPFSALNFSQHQGFFLNESALPIRWPKNWSFMFSISPFNEHPGLISFRMDWLDLLAVQGSL